VIFVTGTAPAKADPLRVEGENLGPLVATRNHPNRMLTTVLTSIRVILIELGISA